MTIEIISIGDELLLGQTVNSNAQMIAKKLTQNGFSATQITTLPDEEKMLKEGISNVLKRASCVIVTGGLGPTGDDRTREILAELFETSLAYDEKAASFLVERYGKECPGLVNQATLPKGARALKNHLGSAFGFIFQNEKNQVIALPGVPYEMNEMLEQDVLPFLNEHVKKSKNHLQRTLFLTLLSEMAVDPFLRALEKDEPEVNITICPGLGVLSVYLTAKEGAEKKLKDIEQKIRDQFSTYVFSSSSNEIGEAVHALFLGNKKTLAFGESCTGGKMAAACTSLSGASSYFLGSVVSYANQVKEDVLKVSQETLEIKGAVSLDTVEEMAKGVFALTAADYIVTVSGVAGPQGGTKKTPVGTVCAAILENGKNIFRVQFQAKGPSQRKQIVEYTINYLLGSLWRYLKHGEVPFKG